MKAKISLIIPVYNAEKILKNCLDSVLAQTFCDFECILVNDGSTDGSREICEEYCKKDGRFALINKENGGVSSARNIGIANSYCDYISFADCDDALLPNYLENLYDENFDICASGIIWKDFSDKKEISRIYGDDYLGELSKDVFAMNFTKGIFNNVYAKCIKKEMLTKNEILFDESISYVEDTLFIVKTALACKNIKISRSCDYVYYRYGGGTLSSGFSAKKYRDGLFGNSEILKEVSQKFNFDAFEIMKERFWFLFETNALMCATTAQNMTDKEKKDFLKEIFSNEYYKILVSDIDKYSAQSPAVKKLLKSKNAGLMLMCCNALKKLRNFKQR